jgi:hypothetical protein
MTTTTITFAELTEAEKEELDGLVLRAHQFIVDSPASYEIAGELRLALRAKIKQFTAKFDDARELADHAHKAVVRLIAESVAPPKQADQIYDGKMKDWRKKEERERRAEEDRVQKIARKEEQARRDAEVERLMDAGQPKVAEALMDAPPSPPPPVVLRTAVPKIKGLPVRTRYKHRVIDPAQVPHPEWTIPNDKGLAAYAISTKGTGKIPGVEFYTE